MGRVRQYARKDEDEEASYTSVAYTNWSAMKAAAPPPIAGQPTPTYEPPKDVKYDVSYDTSFFQHYFDTGVEKEKGFAPTYRLATTVAPYLIPAANSNSGSSSSTPNVSALTAPEDKVTPQNWIHFYFNSKFDGQTGVKALRPNLHLVVVLDISGSMSEAFKGEYSSSKLTIAKRSLLTLLKQLHPEDSFGLVAFNDQANVISPLTAWKDIDAVDLEKQLAKLRATGGTEISNACKTATALFTSKETERTGYSNRLIFLTDMEVTTDDGNKFKQHVLNNSNNNLWSTVVGVGLDLSSDVIKSVSKTVGCNYCNVRSSATFDELMNQEFACFVHPIAFNIQITLDSQRYKIVQGYGSPEVSDIKPGENTVTLSTEFPSVKNDKGETRSGVILFRIVDTQKEAPHEAFKMNVVWDDASGIRHKDSQELNFGSLTPSTTSSDSNVIESTFQNSGVRKAILLVRYTDFLKKYLALRSAKSTSESLELFQAMRKLFNTVVTHFVAEMSVLDDKSLDLELNQLLETAKMDDVPVDHKSTNSNNNNDNNNNTNNNNNNDTQTPAPIPVQDAKPVGGDASGDDTLCCVCLANKHSVTLFPCNHQCLCLGCALKHKLTTCPLCRTPIQGNDAENDARPTTRFIPLK